MTGDMAATNWEIALTHRRQRQVSLAIRTIGPLRFFVLVHRYLFTQSVTAVFLSFSR